MSTPTPPPPLVGRSAESDPDRRTFLALCAAAAGASLASRMAFGAHQPPATVGSAPTSAPANAKSQLKGRVKHSVAAWPLGGVEMVPLCTLCTSLGISSVELVGLEWWPTLKEHGLTCAVAVGPTKFTRGPANPEHHEWLHKRLSEMLPRTADAGCPAMVIYTGTNAGRSDAEGLTHCVDGLKRVAPIAEKSGVTLLLAVKNSKIDHPDYLARFLAQGVDVVKRVGSPRVKVLCNIYDMQVMEGDLIRSITANIDHIGHFQVAGVPGRHEIHQTQELNYRAIVKAIMEAKTSDGGRYEGYFGYEFQPTINATEALKRAIEVCDV